MLPSPTEITYFLEIAKNLNISRASERLGVTQPTLSIAIKKLEGNIGEKLLIRSKSGVQLTTFGQRFLVSAQKIFEEWEKLRGIALSEKNEVQGQYTIGCHPSVALYTLFHFLPDFLQRCPKLNINLVHDVSRYITEKIISYKIDFGIVVNPINHLDLVITELTKDCVTFWTSVGNKNKDILICDHHLLQTQTLIKKIKSKKWPFTRVIDCSNLEVITSLVENGCGVGILPVRVAEKAQNLCRYDDNSPIFEDVIALVYRYDTQNSLAGKEIIKEIKSIFKK